MGYRARYCELESIFIRARAFVYANLFCGRAFGYAIRAGISLQKKFVDKVCFFFRNGLVHPKFEWID